MRAVIVGNSGSGKTWLATQLASIMVCNVVHLDELFWEPGGFDRKRAPEAVESLILSSKISKSWIVEGVFGELAQRYLDQADLLVWLDIGWSTCKERLERRGSESKKHLGREQSEAGLRRLLEWASSYDTRTDLRSYIGHREMYEKFCGRRLHLRDEGMVHKFLHDIQRATAEGARTCAPEL